MIRARTGVAVLVVVWFFAGISLGQKETPPPKPKPTAPPSAPAAQPAKPETPPAKPPAASEKPAAPPAKPATTSEKPAAPPAKPATTSEKPAAPPAKPATTSEKPAAPPAKPATTSEKPAAPPAKPAAAPAKPAPEIADVMRRTMELRASLDTRLVTLNLQKAKLFQAVNSLASTAKVNIVLDDALPASVRGREVTISLSNASLRTAVTALARPDLTFEVVQEAICISTRAGIADLIAAGPIIPDDLLPKGKAIVQAMRHKLISFSFENARFEDALAVLSQLTDVKIVLDPAIPPQLLRTVDLTMTDVHLQSALFYLTGKKLNAAVCLGAFFISTTEGVQKELARRAALRKHFDEKEKFSALLATPVTCIFAKMPLNDAVASLGKQAKTMIVFDPGVFQSNAYKAVVTAKLEAVPLSDALNKILPPTCDYAVSEEGTIEIRVKETKKTAPPPAKKK